MIRILFLFAIISGPAVAECDLSGLDFNAMRKAHVTFEAKPSKKSAAIFFKSIPNQFCQFMGAYGNDQEAGAHPLSDLKLQLSLSELPKYLKVEAIAEKYVALASGASWGADNVKILQDSYRSLIHSNPDAVLNRFASLKGEQRNTAIIFLFDGPHPGNTGFNEDQLNKLCSVDNKICEEIKLTYDGLVKSAEAQELPAGWRMPTLGELMDKDHDYRAMSPDKYAVVKADFNGDGIEDHAFLLKSTEFSGEGLWVKLSMPTNDFAWINLRTINWGPEHPDVTMSMGIDFVPSGTHAYACFEDDKVCNYNLDGPQLDLKNPGLTYFRFEKTSSIYFWSSDENRFRRVWTNG